MSRRLQCLGMFFCFLFIFLNAAVSAAESDSCASTLYVEDRWSLQVLTGPMCSSSLVGPEIPDLDYWQTNVRLGRMLSSPDRDGRVLDGNAELLLEITNSLVMEGFGDYIGGVAAIVRYNLTGCGTRFVPYVQAGLGVVYADAYKDETQTAVGQAINLSPQAGIGFRYLLGGHWSIDAEGRYEHISNAGMDDRNDGVNAFGGFVGLTYFWGDL